MSTGLPHLERTAHEPRDKSLHSVTLKQIDDVNEQVRLFRLGLKAGPMKFSAGQWLDVYAPNIPRAGGYTITSPPSKAEDPKSPYVELAIQASPDNPAAWFWRAKEDILGSELRIRVGGSFIFPPPTMSIDKIRRVVFLAGGVGINPLMSMMSSLGETKFDVDVRVLYASKIPQDGLGHILFFERISKLFSDGALSGRLQIFVTKSQADSSRDVPGVIDSFKRMNSIGTLYVQAGRFTLADVETAVGSKDQAGTLVYVCGPPKMTDEMVETLTSEKLGLKKDQVLSEKWW